MPKKIFLVDDDEFVRESLQALLEAHAFTVDAFTSGQDFLRRRETASGGCLLLDIQMPGMSGFDLLKTLRTRRDDTPVVFITGRRDRSAEAQAAALGAVALLDKPTPHAALLAALEQALGLRNTP
jgi:two-component system response regulator FixJ